MNTISRGDGRDVVWRPYPKEIETGRPLICCSGRITAAAWFYTVLGRVEDTSRVCLFPRLFEIEVYRCACCPSPLISRGVAFYTAGPETRVISPIRKASPPPPRSHSSHHFFFFFTISTRGGGVARDLKDGESENCELGEFWEKDTADCLAINNKLYQRNDWLIRHFFIDSHKGFLN